MITEIVEGISARLSQVFGDEYEMYKTEAEVENLEKPGFFITLVEASRRQMIGLRYFCENRFIVRYYPGMSVEPTQMYQTAERLYSALKFISLVDEDLVHGTRMRYEIVNGILLFYVNYDMSIKEQAEIEHMGMVGIHTEAVNG